MNKKGFTLIELLVTVSIIGILSTLGLTSFQDSAAKSRDGTRKEDLSKIATALELYSQSNGRYITGSGSCLSGNASSTLYTDANFANLFSSGIPKDPKTRSEYCYESDATGSTYKIYTKFEKCSDPNIISASTCQSANYNFYLGPDGLMAYAALTTPPPPPAPVPIPPPPTPIPPPPPGGTVGADDNCLTTLPAANTCSTTSIGGRGGWVGAIPACGATGTWRTCSSRVGTSCTNFSAATENGCQQNSCFTGGSPPFNFFYVREFQKQLSCSSPPPPPPAPQPDVVISNVAITGTLTSGSTISFSGDVGNGPNATANLTTLNYYRFCIDSTNAAGCSALTSGTRIGTDRCIDPACIAPNTAINGWYTGLTPGTNWIATAGTHTVYHCGDVSKVVSEIDETNNCSSSTFTVAASPPPPPATGSLPTVTTNAATSISTTTAILQGNLNTNGTTATGWFRYSTTNPGTCNDTFGTRVPTTGGDTCTGCNSGYGQSLSGLSSVTTYYFCAIASNSVGTSFGTVLSFTTTGAPSVTTNKETGTTGNSTTLNGSANPNGLSATGWFRYSTTNPGTCNDTFGTRSPASGSSSLGSTSITPYSQLTIGLSTGTIYYFCAIASNSVGTSFGTVLSFTTPAAAPPPPSCTPTTWYGDADNDTFGNPAVTTSSCSQPAGYVANSSDCYDSNANAKPGQINYYTAQRGDGSYDYDCDGSPTKPSYQDCLTTFSATMACGPTKPAAGGGGYTSAVPACGQWAIWRVCENSSSASCSSTSGNFMCGSQCSTSGIAWRVSDTFPLNAMPCK